MKIFFWKLSIFLDSKYLENNIMQYIDVIHLVIGNF